MAEVGKQSDPDRTGSAGALIQVRRRAAGLTQRALAERSGVSVGAIRDLEQGRTAWPRPGAVPGLARALGLHGRQATLLAGPQGGGQRDAGPRGERGSHDRGPAGDIRVAVLGPLVAWRDAVPLDLGAERQRALLALLAMSAGRPVHRAGIIDAIWGEAPPPSAVSMIQSHVSRLRDALGADRGSREPGQRHELLVSLGESYLLRLRAEQLDVQEFGALAGRARERAAAGDAAGACELYARAAGLWRGEAAADVGLLRGHPAVAALARQRTAVVLEYAQAAAAAGWHGRVLEQLRALAEREPLDERALARLMIALGATGQQAAALRVFEEARTRLDQELGVTPGPELAEAHLRILRGETQPGPRGGAAADHAETARPVPRPKATAGEAAVRAGPRKQADQDPRDRGPGRARAPVTLLPRQLPSAVRHFTGRDAELKALWEVADQAGQRPGAVVISAIGGMAGVGKTALAVHWAQQAAGRFPDGQLFADLRGAGPAADPAEPTQVIGWFLGSLSVPAAQVPADPQAQAALLRTVLADKRMLIVLDNARDADQVRPLLPGSPGCLVLVTSRARLIGLAAADGATVLDLDVLDTREAHELLARRLGRVRLDADQATAGELVELCGRLPLALSIIAARAAARPGFALAALAAELRDEADRLDALDTGEPASSIRQVFSWSYRQLTTPAARMFRLLGVHPGPDISAPAAASLAGVSPVAARRARHELAACHLLTEPSPGRYALHDLLRAYAAELAVATDSEPNRRAALGRVFDHYLHVARTADLLLNPARTPITIAPPRPGVTPEHLGERAQAMAWFDAEHRVLLTTVALTAEQGFDAHAWQLPWAMTSFLDWQGRWQDLATTQRTALEAAGRLRDDAGQAIAHRLLAVACVRLDDHDQACAHLTDCIRLHRQLGDRDGEARAYQALGIDMAAQGRVADALRHSERALALFRTTGNRTGQAGSLNNVGYYHAKLGDYERARAFCRQSLAMHQELADRYNEAHIWDSVGYAEHKLGQFAEAVTCYRNARRLFREFADRYFEATIGVHLGDVQQAAGDLSGARTDWQQALRIFEDLGSPEADEVRAKLRDL
jgi:DNA-binding SARP family transcriptional activator